MMICTGSLGVWMIFMYPPARHEALVEPTASTSQAKRQFLVFLSTTSAPPNPNPFCAGRLPTAMCTGVSVKTSMAHPGTVLKPKSLQASLARSASRRNSACNIPSWDAANVLARHSANNKLRRILPPTNRFSTFRQLRRLRLPAKLRLGFFLGFVRSNAGAPPHWPVVCHSRNFAHALPLGHRPGPLCDRSCMREVDRLGHPPDVIRSLALRLDRINVNIRVVADGKLRLCVVQVKHLRLQQRIDRPVRIHRISGSGHVDESHFRCSLGAA